jgi:hypothetical protein
MSKLEVQQQGQLSGHLHAAVVENPNKMDEVRFRTSKEC